VRLHRFRPDARHARVAVTTLGLTAAALLAHGALYAWRLASGGDLTAATTATTLAVYGLQLTLPLAASTFVAWLHRAYGNVRAVGGSTLHGTGWAIGSWFVPFLQFYRPMQIAREMWRHAGTQRVGGHGLVALWWSATLLGLFLASAAPTWPRVPDARRPRRAPGSASRRTSCGPSAHCWRSASCCA